MTAAKTHNDRGKKKKYEDTHPQPHDLGRMNRIFDEFLGCMSNVGGLKFLFFAYFCHFKVLLHKYR